MPEYIVVVRVSAGYLVKVSTDTPEEAAARVEKMPLKQVQTEEFFVNRDPKVGNVWDDSGNIVLTTKS